LKWVVF